MKKTFFVENMKCQGCVSNIRQAVTALTGVQTFTAELPEKLVNIVFDEKQTNANQILAAIQAAGYKAQLK